MTAAGLELVLPAVPGSIAAIRKAVADAAVELDADADSVDAVKLAVSEAVTNVVRHAYGAERGEVHVAVEPQASALVVRVEDDGRGVADRPHDGTGGYGLRIMRALSRCCDVASGPNGGTSIRMVFSLAGVEQRSGASGPHTSDRTAT